MFLKPNFNLKFLFVALLLVLITISTGYFAQRDRNSPIAVSPIAVLTSVESKGETDSLSKQQISESYGRLPINFEPNVGQIDEQVKFIARGDGYGLFLTGKEAVLSLRKRGKTRGEDKQAIVQMQIEGANLVGKLRRVGRNGEQIELFYRQ